MAAFLQFTMTSFPCSLVEVQIFAVRWENEHFFFLYELWKFKSSSLIWLFSSSEKRRKYMGTITRKENVGGRILLLIHLPNLNFALF